MNEFEFRYDEVSLDTVLRTFANSYSITDGKVKNVQYFVDLFKDKVIFKLFVQLSTAPEDKGEKADMNKDNPIWQNLQRFANEHKVILEDRGEIGFGRPCVGFLRQSYIAFNPTKEPDYDYVWPEDIRLRPPKTVVDAYHKHDCLAVLVHGDDYDKALAQLNAWVGHLEAQGTVELAQYKTGATGIQAIISGYSSFAFRFTQEEN